ncbi:aromatic ring-hydroxylating dioxygenase subunit alpha [Candidatus Njordibacter sp. Uisw_056]|jgi:methanesulfonate monooxygenase large subunit|uniref:aromatic ring-hydroxylating oxygenase subunit alpha n=1 Tax=Candidatus Njordibacter sp. Uisw_056 TaxID=3230973 RepID=UPI003D59DD12|tara:strand:- start:2389 stop:3669 length:1281 start_codon:yes stop_codon:yes gene_type:complete
MSSRNHDQWNATPDLQQGEWVDSKIYSDEEIFEDELKKIWSKTWIPVCHESELKEAYSFRTMTVAREPVIVVRGKDMVVRAFLNVCPHRGNMIERRPSGNYKRGTPSGTPKTMTCMFHAWSFDMKGKCVNISRKAEGYQDRLNESQVGLRELKCEVYFGGFVWVSLNDDIGITVEEFAAGSLDVLAPSLNQEPLEVFHYHKAIIPCNYKLWHDTNCEFYHDYLHYHNRITGFNEAYFARKNSGFDGGHINVGSFEVQYDNYEGSHSREELSFPHLPPNHWYMIDMFPGVNFNLRGSALRCDLMTPLGPNSVMIEFRGLGLASDSKKDRQTRIDHHNSIWGPFGRNLHEDLLAVTGQGSSMHPMAESRKILHGRHENETIHDENGMRHYYEEWGKLLNRSPSNPDEKFKPYPAFKEQEAQRAAAAGK